MYRPQPNQCFPLPLRFRRDLRQVSVFSPAAGLKSGQFNQKTNSGLAESDMRCQVKKTQDLNPNTSSQETGTSFLRYGAALWVVFIICAIYCRFLGYLPTPLSLWNLLLQCFLQSIQHPYALFIAISIFFIQPFREVTFEFRHEKMVNRYRENLLLP